MKKEDLVIGKEYYFYCRKDSKGTYQGKNKSGSIFFKPTSNHDYLEETDEFNGFINCVGFISSDTKITV